jgi:hypothetical protein
MLSNQPSRKVTRDLHEGSRDHARALMATPEFDKSRDEHKKVEMLCASVCACGASPARAPNSTSMLIVQNLKTFAKYIWRPSPHEPTPALREKPSPKPPVTSHAHPVGDVFNTIDPQRRRGPGGRGGHCTPLRCPGRQFHAW